MSAFANILVLALAEAARLTTGANNGPAFDLRPYSGEGRLVLNSSAGETADTTLNVTIEESDTGTGSWSAVSGLDFEEVTDEGASHQVLAFNIDQRKRFIRAVRTVAGTSPFVSCAVDLVAKTDGAGG